MLDKIFANVIAWAETEDAIRAAILEGSRARQEHRVDRFSDYDLNLYVTEAAQFTRSAAWIEQIGPVWAMEKETEPDGTSSRLVLFAGGYDIDFKFVPVTMLHTFVEQLWHVKIRDACIKNRLLQMIEWHAQAGHHWDYDTWMVGKYMQSWVAPETWQAFFEIFARFDVEDSWRAVCALMPLYRRLAGETARQLSYAYPDEMDQAISEFILGTWR